MLSRTAARRAAPKGASGAWFGSGQRSDSWSGCLASFLAGLIGIGVINQFTRGNVLGDCTNQAEIVMPVRDHLPVRRAPPLPDTSGFAGDDEGAPAVAKRG